MLLRRLTMVMQVAAAAMLGLPAIAADIHDFWDRRCAECHGHAAAFARGHLVVVDGKLQGTHHKQDLKRFMGQHEMGPALVGDIYAMLLAQAVSAPLYQQKCAACHDTAAKFARASLILRDGVIVGKSNRLPLAEYLQRHGRLKPEEIGVVVDALTRVHREIDGATVR